MAKLSVTDPNTLHGVVTALGGRVIPGPSFKFELPQEDVREVVPKLNSTRPSDASASTLASAVIPGKSIAMHLRDNPIIQR